MIVSCLLLFCMLVAVAGNISMVAIVIVAIA